MKYNKRGNILTIGVVGFVVTMGSALMIDYIDKTLKLYDYKIETAQGRYEVEQSEQITIGLFDNYFNNSTIQLKYIKDIDVDNQYNLYKDTYLFKDSQLNNTLELNSFSDTLQSYTNNKYVNVDISVNLDRVEQSLVSTLASGIDKIDKETIKTSRFNLDNIPIKVSVTGAKDKLEVEFMIKGIQIVPKTLGYEGDEYCNIEYRFNTSKMKIETTYYSLGGSYEN